MLVVLGGVLVLTGLRGGSAEPAPGGAGSALGGAGLESGAAGSTGSALGPTVGLRIVAPDPARTLPQVTEALAAAAPSLAFQRGMQRWRAALERVGVDPERDLLAPFSVLVISLERSCPPPALLACRPAIRVIGRLRGEPPADLDRNLQIAIVAGLRVAGFRALSLYSTTEGDRFGGRVTSSEETLARWRLSSDVLEVATGGLALDSAADAAATLPPPPTGTSEVEIDTNPRTLAAILG
jgi:hypothetical protein